MATQKLLVERRKVNEGLLQDVKDIKDMLVNMQKLEAARVERETHNNHKVECLEKTVNGNGTPGLKIDVQLLKEQMTRIYWLGSVIVVALIGNFIAVWFK